MIDPVPLYHSWPLTERRSRFNSMRLERGEPGGQWSCDLATEELTWEPEIYALFGFPVGEVIARRTTADRYIGRSRDVMEELRAHAISHRRGFTVDVEIAPADGAAPRWMRLMAAPICVNRRVVALEGIKWAIATPT
ncbi:MAG: hypothetical protein P0Y64_16185 [Candidatus Sphingomonas colombiensis]|nr:hypothetical protein [Sphingomonas sp.]WEK42865.1 MAG: hypothetical protein P0Y64_16185 [Sphingomonas sp.]